MFTGIIEAIGTVARVEQRQGDIRLTINSGKLDLSDVQLGDSIATNGVCLTVVELPGHGFCADVSRESLQHTLIGDWQTGQRVNLEKALTPATRMGGHMVTGHVDGVARIIDRHADARSIRFTLEPPAALRKYIAAKGSVTIDGISLTANAISEQGFELNIVPHTAEQTTLFHAQVGQHVHLEVDIIARYLEQLFKGEASQAANSRLSPAFLAEHGFWK